jgi:PKD repeat protein
VVGPAGNVALSVTQSDTTITGLMAGTYMVKSFSNGILTSEETAIVQSHAPVLPTFTTNTNTEGQNVDIFFTNTTGINLSWTWDMGDGNTYNTLDATHQYNTTGSYTVTLTATDSNGCVGSVTDTMLITYAAPMVGPSNFNNNNPNPRSSNTTGNFNPTVNQRNGNTIVIEQNDENPIAQIVVYTVAGQHIATVDANSKITEVNVPQGGCYIVMMNMSNGEVKSERIVLGL